jgi:hypothetical protein
VDLVRQNQRIVNRQVPRARKAKLQLGDPVSLTLAKLSPQEIGREVLGLVGG